MNKIESLASPSTPVNESYDLVLVLKVSALVVIRLRAGIACGKQLTGHARSN